jgi:hypothetical protein
MRVAIVPGVPALLPEYAGLEDPIPELRTAVEKAVAWLAEDGPAAVWANQPVSGRVGRALLESEDRGPGRLVIGNGSAMRTEKAPGHFDERAEAFDAALGRALATGDTATLAAIDGELAHTLWADVESIRALGRDFAPKDVQEIQVDYDDSPYGVQYWVVRWRCAS